MTPLLAPASYSAMATDRRPKSPERAVSFRSVLPSAAFCDGLFCDLAWITQNPRSFSFFSLSTASSSPSLAGRASALPLAALCRVFSFLTNSSFALMPFSSMRPHLYLPLPYSELSGLSTHA
ncbi:hypothetical protein D9M69_651880 [compost metagenome]